MVDPDVLRIRTVQRTLAVIVLAAAMASAVSTVHAQSPPGESLFVRASVDNDRPYLGQQVTYIFKVYQRSDFFPSAGQLDELRYNPPDFSGFWNNQATEQYEYADTVDSNQYRVVELRTVLFPSVVGTVAIEPAALAASTGSSGTPNLLETGTVVVEVGSLPSGAPAGFTGAVGRFDISADVDTAIGKVNEPVQLTVKVSGEGNIEALPDPSWPEFADWRVIESPAEAAGQVVDGRLTGSRTYGNVLVPERAGDLTIPEIGYTYFDPNLEEYVRATTRPIVMSIAGADGVAAPPTSANLEAAVERDGPEVRHIKAVPSSLSQSGRDLTGSVMYWAAWGIPALAIVGAAAWRRRRAALEAALALSRRQNALATAKADLARAAASGADPGVAVAEAVLSYVSDRLETPVTGLTREALGRRLREAGVPPELEIRVNDTLAAGEAAKYTPLAGSADRDGDYLARAAQLLTDLQGAIDA